MTVSTLEDYLRCECGRFDPTPGTRRCRGCGETLLYFRAGEACPGVDVDDASSAVARPTPADLVWTGGPRDALALRLHAVDALLARIATTPRVAADVAGGAGRWLPHLAPSFDLYLHADLSVPALRYAGVRHRGAANVVLVRNDLVAARPRIRNVDLALCLDTLLYDGDFVPHALRSVRGILRPGGHLIAEFTSRVHSGLGRLVRGARHRGPRRTFWLTQARRVARESGFAIVAEYVLYRELPAQLNDALQALRSTPLREAATWFYLLLRAPGGAAASAESRS